MASFEVTPKAFVAEDIKALYRRFPALRAAMQRLDLVRSEFFGATCGVKPRNVQELSLVEELQQRCSECRSLKCLESRFVGNHFRNTAAHDSPIEDRTDEKKRCQGVQSSDRSHDG